MEDCEVCCNPISLEISVKNNDIFYFQASGM
ncbi:CPXCG motif-containing cysteine-rich protein [Mangrovimonas sp. DI 80]|nr:CPXCG motif-containing cysteine-rich protein [Mangrovimonas sp. DI 80]